MDSRRRNTTTHVHPLMRELIEFNDNNASATSPTEPSIELRVETVARTGYFGVYNAEEIEDRLSIIGVEIGKLKALDKSIKLLIKRKQMDTIVWQSALLEINKTVRVIGEIK